MVFSFLLLWKLSVLRKIMTSWEGKHEDQWLQSNTTIYGGVIATYCYYSLITINDEDKVNYHVTAIASSRSTTFPTSNILAHFQIHFQTYTYTHLYAWPTHIIFVSIFWLTRVFLQQIKIHCKFVWC